MIEKISMKKSFIDEIVAAQPMTAPVSGLGVVWVSNETSTTRILELCGGDWGKATAIKETVREGGEVAILTTQ